MKRQSVPWHSNGPNLPHLLEIPSEVACYATGAMLEHVALNQARFNTPGVAPDNRGVLLGKQAVVLFSSVDRLVGFFRVYTDESSMDDLLAKLKIHQVRSPLEAKELLVVFHATSSYLVDRVARMARMFGGLTFTGSGKHFVKYRDDASPLGYDLVSLGAEQGDFILYSETFTQAYTRVKDVPFDQLVFRLSLRAIPGGAAHIEQSQREVLWLAVQPGLMRATLGYLWRNRVKAEAAQAKVEAPKSAFGASRGLFLVRVQDLPLRMLNLFGAVPGIEIHQPITDTCVVQLGWRHPLRLESCAAVFEKDKFYVFSGERDAVDVVAGMPPLVPAHDLIGTHFELGERGEPRALLPEAAEKIQIALRLVPAPLESSRRRVTATLVPWSQADWLRRLVYALPPTLLSSYRVAAIAEGLFIMGEQGIDGLPLGDMFHEVAPAIYAPLGFELLPKVSAQVLTDQVGGTSGRYVLFLRGGDGPLGLEQALFEPLGRRALARLETSPRDRDLRMPPPRIITPATVVNEEAGSLPLWGWTDKDPRG